MRAVQSGVKDVLEGSKQYVLPLYQRRYSWSLKHWTTLVRDVERLLAEPNRASHFIGSFVTAPLDHAADQSVNRYRLIDGQQRLTTLTLLLCALRDVAKANGRDDLAGMIDGLYLKNPYTKGDAARKLLPTGDDRADLFAVLDGQPRPGRIGDAYRFFHSRLSNVAGESLEDARQAILGRLSVVSITLDAGDDPHLIFESLNAKGERLTQADLLRNYFMMRLPQDDDDGAFSTLWLPMQQRLGDDLTNFFRHYLMQDPDSAEVRKDEVYDEVKDRVNDKAPMPADVFDMLKHIVTHAAAYARLIRPAEFETDPDIQARLKRLHRLKVTTAYPFLLSLMEAIRAGRLSQGVLASTLDVIEAFLVRRLVCGIPTNQLRQIFRGLCRSTHIDNDTAFIMAIRMALTQKQRCPNDAMFTDAIVRRPSYGGSKRDIARYLLERLELSYGHKETADPTATNVQLEHVLPQTLTDAWRAELSPADPPAADDVQGQWLHTLGNLTLTGYNPELSNQPFPAKKQRFAGSHFVLNDHFTNVATWNAAAIESRGQRLAKDASALWADPGLGLPAEAAQEKSRTKAVVTTAVVVNGERKAVTSTLDAAHHVFDRLHETDPAGYARAVVATLSQRRRAASPDHLRAARRVGDQYIDLHGSSERLQQLSHMLAANMGLPASAVQFETASR